MSRELIKLNQIFELYPAKSKGIDSYDSGYIPFVTSSETNNGVVGYVDPEEDDRVFSGIAIVISGLGHATVHLGNFLPKGNGGDSLTILKPYEQTLTEQAIELWNRYIEIVTDLLVSVNVINILGLNFDFIFKSEKENIKDIEKQLGKCEEKYKSLSMHGITIGDLISFAAAFNTLHKWRFSYGRKCSINRIENLEIPFPLPKVSEVWEKESNLVSSINTMVDEGIKEKVLDHT